MTKPVFEVSEKDLSVLRCIFNYKPAPPAASVISSQVKTLTPQTVASYCALGVVAVTELFLWDLEAQALWPSEPGWVAATKTGAADQCVSSILGDRAEPPFKQVTYLC